MNEISFADNCQSILHDNMPWTDIGPIIIGVGTAVPQNSLSQTDILCAFRIDDPRVRSVFLRGGIARRNLSLPDAGDDGRPYVETQTELLGRHLRVGLDIGQQAIDACLLRANAQRADIRHLCCVSSTGYVIPGLSALLIKAMELPVSCSRLDVVGMGCNAGLNALAAVSAWASCHPDQLTVMVCIEVCSAMYVFDTDMASAVVNSLFGDGAAAVALIGGSGVRGGRGPRIAGFASHLVPDASHAMRLVWSDAHSKFRFCLDPDVPYVVGAHAARPVEQLLQSVGMARSDIAHWIVHSGGRKVIDAIRVNLGLTRADVRHTLGVLRDHGNLSSASFLFSYERLLAEGIVARGEVGLMMTMGPGTSIETAVLQW
jgi:3,5-dihydroxyphenylacetyl-CoA synthase